MITFEVTMSGGAGHIFAMIARMKANEALRKKKSYTKTMQDYLHVTGEKLNLKKATKEELLEIREKIKASRKVELKQTILSIFITVVVLVGLVWLIVFFLKRIEL